MPLASLAALQWYGPACAAMVVDDAIGTLHLAGARTIIRAALSVTGIGSAEVLRPYRGYQAALSAFGDSSIVCTPHQRMRAGLTVNVGAVPTAEDIAQIMWGSAAAKFNAAGTMGAKLNAAGSGGVDLDALSAAVWDYTVRSLTVESVAPSAATVATAVRAELATELARVDAAVTTRTAAGTTVNADVRYVNGVAITGTGADDDIWGPA